LVYFLKKKKGNHDVPLWTVFEKKKKHTRKNVGRECSHSRRKKSQKNVEWSVAPLHVFLGFFAWTKKVTRYSDARPNLGLLGPKKITFSDNISKKFVPKTARKRKNNGKTCPFRCFPRPMVTQTTHHLLRWKARDKAHQNKQKKSFFFKKKIPQKKSTKFFFGFFF
jgi:hypothetical protein